ncbi:triphosphoribosyl-dephospho-CoA synthase [Robbsia sp. Bb-Pol-6]|uniref:Probable 2-(5''-triphosphoribosyl)-3'-dephosphocoenzyme-A synthase n=1 Tax=Robbsia betulipollinis TaxID=2981849 RepID=A0ABT3ZKT0_9BURK|nr:triphosphoribosyl-dephospho-CoA synthase [Robbsia betulipollinis]MCY0387022.1 triphosphoribosyl-dephospho-CoA synthase [Robbsia betulipollinis]
MHPLPVASRGVAGVHGVARADTAQAEWLAAQAVAALIDEAELTPKPALVDQRGSGAHVDLDLPLMRRSAQALRPGFMAMARAAQGRLPDQPLREQLAAIGRDAERAMLAVTSGSNAHRGAIWILGLLVAAAALGDASSVSHAATALAERAAGIARYPDRHAPVSALADSHGARVRARYGAAGARGEALAGFPHVVNIGLPALRAARARREPETAARLNALVAIVAVLEDTCLLHRGGAEALATARRGAARILAAGGVAQPAGHAALLRLDHELLARNASPGGAADLLAATLFIDRIQPDGWRIAPSVQE